jgi:pyrroline-5-carboxylate reductase
MKIVLVGVGNMGLAMLNGFRDYDVELVEKSPERIKALKIEYPNLKISNSPPPIDGYVVILAVKPQALESLNLKGNAKAVISILAGVSLSTIKSKVKAEFYIRAMPNIAAIEHKSITSIVGDEGFRESATEILSSIGETVWLKSEKELDIATGLVGSSPAWLALVAEALSDGAVSLGLSRDKSYEYLPTLFEGVGALLRKYHPAVLKDRVMSPDGTTSSGYRELEGGKVRDSFIKAMESAYEKSLKLNRMGEEKRKTDSGSNSE